MRLGLLGPTGPNPEALERAARFLLSSAGAERVVYLGVDGALDLVVERWAAALVGGDPSERAIWQRARTCVAAQTGEIERFIARERDRRALRIFESFPANARTIEMLNGKLAVLIHDKAQLDEEDMLPAGFLVYGCSKEPLVKEVGRRWFISPGCLERFGVMILEDLEDGVHLGLYDGAGRELHRQRLTAESGARVRVSG